MGIYCYKTESGRDVDVVMSCDEKTKREFIRDGKTMIELPTGELAFKDIQRQLKGVIPVGAGKKWPVYSDAAGVHPSQIKEAYEHSVKIGFPTQFTSDGRAIFNSPKHRKGYCEAIGLFDKNAGYSDPVPTGKIQQEVETEEYSYG